MILSANKKQAFNYGMFNFDPSLFLAMKVYDVTDASPVLVDTIPMAFLSGGYVGYFTPSLARIYYIDKSVYTDGTYATLDTNYAPSIDTFEALVLSGESADVLVLDVVSDDDVLVLAVWDNDTAVFLNVSDEDSI